MRTLTVLLGILLGTAAHAGPPRTFGIPPGHLPAPGLCRIWTPGMPPGHQPPPIACAAAFRHAAPGTWVVERPPARVDVVRIYEIVRTSPRPRPSIYVVR